jgi:uncharacterized membrane protein
MNEWLKIVAQGAITIIHAMALLLICAGTLQAFIRAIQAFFKPSPTGEHFNEGYILYARWLVAALTFQLAADILQTAFAAPLDWNGIGHLGAIAVIRTLLNFFLERDLAEMERRRKPEPDATQVNRGR